ncbi:MAG TPA: TetR/AcrR family transcriptional regulator [Clostridia bacterium]|nr:TetR/AcrR family transcriptional regulator [Clostridia bacterium]
MRKRDSAETKEKILRTAELIFAEKGFDGARVDDIAKRAGVNKALIYYYFKSKDEILNELFETLMADGSQVQNDSLTSYPDLSREEIFREFFEKSLDYAVKHRSLIKIAFIESMKTDSKHPKLLERCTAIIDKEVEHIRKVYESKGLAFPYTRKDFAAMEFFLGIMPIFNYAVYFDRLMELYEMSEMELKEQFIKAFRMTHMQSHQNKYWEKL